MINQQQINEYFAGPWRAKNRGIEKFQLTGYNLIEKIEPGESVIDVGCGSNPFRGRIPNLVGVDPAFPEADYQMTLEEFVNRGVIQRFNVAFCLGSVNFGTHQDVENQIALLMRVMRTRDTRIYWRCNPGVHDHGNPEFDSVPVYAWTFEDHIEWAEKFGYEIRELEWDTNNRIYAEWVHKSGPSNTYLPT
jgi:hypothetical protein